MAMTPNVGMDVRQNFPAIGGGAVGVGAPAVLREFADVQNNQPFSLIGDPGSMLHRISRPSVVWGLGVGGVSGALYMVSAGPEALEDFYLAHALTSIPTGVLSAIFPAEPCPTEPVPEAASGMDRVPQENRPSSNGSSEFSPSGGRSQETAPAR